MEAEKVEIMDAEVIESKPLPVSDIAGTGLMIGSFFLGYVIGNSGRKKMVRRRTIKLTKPRST